MSPGKPISDFRSLLIVIVGLIVVLWLSAQKFYEGLFKGDPQSIFLVALLAGGLVLVLVVNIIDRRINPDKKQPRPPSRAGS
jgi:hypothetical protein